jgi:hypothetical protein
MVKANLGVAVVANWAIEPHLKSRKIVTLPGNPQENAEPSRLSSTLSTRSLNARNNFLQAVVFVISF